MDEARKRPKPADSDPAALARLTGLAAGDTAGDPDGCGDFGLRIARDGTWFYRNSPIGRKALAKLFSTVLRRDDAGDYWLVTPVERGRIVVDDAPFTAVSVEANGRGRDRILTFRTNLDESVAAGPDHPIRVAIDPETGEPSPYILVRDRLEALILRPVYYELVEIGGEETIEGEAAFGVWSNGRFFPLGSLTD